MTHGRTLRCGGRRIGRMCVLLLPFRSIYTHTLSGVQFISIGDLSAHEAFVALQRLRRTKTKSNEVLHHEVAEYHDVIQYTGGRLSMLNRVARAHDMLATARDLLEIEKGWLRSQVGLIDDCDDDVRVRCGRQPC